MERYSATAERQEGAPELARASDLARELGVTANQIWTWKSRRDVNGFPLPIACTWSPWRDGRWGGKDLYDAEEVRVWFKGYDPAKNRARGGGKNPHGRRGKPRPERTPK
jgi:hypothetical protein